MNITVVGIGYVGLANAILLAQNHRVIALDIIEEKIEMLKDKVSPIQDHYAQKYLKEKELDLYPTTDPLEAYKDAELVIIATPTNYDEEKDAFDTSSIERELEKIESMNPDALVLIKSTIPIGYVEKIRKKMKKDNIVFSPEFLREGHALYDNLYPSRIIVGDQGQWGEKVAALFLEGAEDKETPILLVDPTEAEAIKLFSNTYLALRVSFFNELDSYAQKHDLHALQIIKGVSMDPRIGDYYNNPSFGYGGYCLPKDTKQLLNNFKDTPNKIIEAIVQANDTRKEFIIHSILEKKPKKAGIFRLVMKAGSDNFRSSAIWDIMKGLEGHTEIVVFEPTVGEDQIEGYVIENDFIEFVQSCDIIIANRLEEELIPYRDKVFTRDAFSRD